MGPPPRIRIPAPGEGEAALELLDNITSAPPRQPARVFLSRTAEHLHVRFECEDAEPWATIRRRDGPLYTEETVEIFVDPFGDLQCYYEIEVNPINTVMDLMLRRVGRGWRKELAWDCAGLETTATTTGIGWTAVLAIPFAALTDIPPAPGAIWRANFLRIDRPTGVPRELSAWSPTGYHTFHESTRFGFLEFA